VTEHPEPPGFRGTEHDGRVLKGVIRTDAYTVTVEWGDRSRLEFVVGADLRDKHSTAARKATSDSKSVVNQTELACIRRDDQSRVELWYDETEDRRHLPSIAACDCDCDCFRTGNSTGLTSEKAALDVGVGANNLVACTTTTGEQYLYEGRELFDQFQETTREIARLQSKLTEGRHTSQRIRRLYRTRTRRRNHAQAALCRDLIERLYDEGVDTVYIGGLTDVRHPLVG
jgi:transposase